MAKVISDFFCAQTKVSYKRGDEYKGSRTDLGHVLEAEEKEVMATLNKQDDAVISNAMAEAFKAARK